ncbi:MAG: response regulator [Bacteroidales bacterium]|nr:response regulator [Bacteroidales bacterium]
MGNAELRKALLTVVFILFFLPLSGENFPPRFYFKNISVSEGLSHNTVNDILQDHTGFMWFATKDGLDRYDGNKIKRYGYSSLPGSLKSNCVNKLYEDEEGIMWVGTDTGLYCYNPATDTFTQFVVETEGGESIEKSVTEIISDSVGVLWVGVEQQGVFYISPDREWIKFLPFPMDVWSLYIEESGKIWIGTYGRGIYYSTDGLTTCTHYPFLQKSVVLCMEKSQGNNMLIGSLTDGIWRIDLFSGDCDKVETNDENGTTIRCHDILMTPSGEYYAATESGLFFYDLRTKELHHFTNSLTDRYSLSDNAVCSVFVDREGGLWAGTYFGGVDYFSKSSSYFEKYYPDGSPSGLQGKRIREFCKDPLGNIWVSSEDGGLAVFNSDNGTIDYIEESRAFKNVHALCEIDGTIWVGSFTDGLRIFDVNTRKGIRSYTGERSTVLKDNGVFSICHLSSGKVLLGTRYGLLEYEKETDSFREIPELEHYFIFNIKEDHLGNVWIATDANGVWCHESDGSWSHYSQEDLNGGTIPFGQALGISEDGENNVWITTQGGGICKFERESKTFLSYYELFSRPCTTVYDIVEDHKGAIWMTTNNGLYRISPNRKEMLVITEDSGLPTNQFSSGSAFLDENGILYLGTIEGFIRFDTNKFERPAFEPKLVVTDFTTPEGTILPGDRIVLDNRQNSFSISLAALCYQNKHMYPIEYMMEGLEDQWILLPSSGEVSYSRLPSGNYSFKARIADAYVDKEGLSFEIRVKPPFYLSWWAFLLYAILAALVFRLLQKYAHQRLLIESERETYKSKIDFFTNVAHEIRTPLSLIDGPLEGILEKKTLDPEIRTDLEIMKRNSENLLRLSNQLLTFRKIEKGGYQLTFKKCDILPLVEGAVERFMPAIKKNGLSIEKDFVQGGITAFVNEDAFKTILDNLIGNAVKYGETNITVRLKDYSKDGEPFFSLTVENDGNLIPESLRDDIFKPFFRYEAVPDSHSGSGIGLPFSRSLAELHGGTLVMVPDSNKNIFSLSLPMKQAGYRAESTQVHEDLDYVEEAVLSDESDQRQAVLVVEDNEDLRLFIFQKLRGLYTVYVAGDGEEAIRVLSENIIHVIVSDVMMPRMDGIELCGKVKSDLRFSHIPVILLTAKTDVESKIGGLNAGADAYIEKPFSIQYLMASVANQLENRRKLQQLFMKSPLALSAEQSGSQEDRKFIEKMDAVIAEHYSDPEFNMDEFAQLMFLSRSSFYRKIKGLLDMGPSELIRYERLKRAADLLVEDRYPISEISVMVGFNSASYFSKCFQAQYGVLPKDYAASIKKGQ